MKRKLSRTAKRRRLIVALIETVIVCCVMFGAILLLGWAAARAVGPISAALDAATRAVIG